MMTAHALAVSCGTTGSVYWTFSYFSCSIRRQTVREAVVRLEASTP